MITQMKLKNQTFILPKEWKGKDIFIRKSGDVIIIKKIEKQAFWGTWNKMKSCAKNIRKADIENAINLAHKNK